MEDSSVLHVVGIDCGDPAKEAEFNDWYTNNHILFVMRSPFVEEAERYQRVGNDEKYPEYLAIYKLKDEKALDGYLKSSIPAEARRDSRKRWPKEGDFIRRWAVDYKLIARRGKRHED